MKTAAALAVACRLGSALALSAAKLRGGASHRSALVAQKELNFGTKDCPCIGIQGLNGTMAMHVEDAFVTYPADVGSYCHAWDDGRDPHSCLEGKEPGEGKGFCAQQWCFVDACNCRGLDQTPAMTRHMQGASYQGRPLYYSYATCGDKDTWTVKNNEMACVNAKTEERCVAAGDNCIWGETPRGKQCMAWEAGGLCMDLPKVSAWGEAKCPCIGFTGINGSAYVGEDKYPAELGSVCKAWDAEHSHECLGDAKAESCSEKWCFVDPENCEIEEKPIKSSYFPEATLNGHPLHYSYETCGGKRPKETKADEAPGSSGTGVKYDEKAYEKDWHDEYGHPKKSKDKKSSDTGFEYDKDAYEEEWHDEYRHPEENKDKK